MKSLIKNWKIVGGVMGVIFCVGVACVCYFSYNGGTSKGVDSFVVDSSFNENAGGSVGKNTEAKNGGKDGAGDNKENIEIYVHVVGEVKNTGVITLVKGQRIIDAIEKAGGVTEKADLSKINLAFILSDGQKIRIPSVDDSSSLTQEFVSSDSGYNVVEGGSVGGKVNINTASQTELETISGVGPSLADKIIKYREKNGKFKSIEELKNVSGIGEVKFEGMKDYVDI